MRTSRIIQLAVLLLLALLVAGCGGGDDGKDGKDGKKGGDSRTASDTSEPAADGGGQTSGSSVEADLKITLTNMGDKSKGAGIPIPSGLKCDKSMPATCHASLECPAADADAPDADLCAWLDGAAETIFDPPPADQACTEIYGGPEVARVTGMIDGDKVDATFSRTNGCEIARWDAAMPLWTGEVPAGPASGGGGTTRTVTSTMCVAEDPSRPVSSDNPPVPCEDMVVEPDVISDPPEAFGQ